MMTTELRLVRGGKFANEKTTSEKIIYDFKERRKKILEDNFSTLRITCALTIKDYREANKAIEKGMNKFEAASILVARIIAREYGEITARTVLMEYFLKVDISKESLNLIKK